MLNTLSDEEFAAYAGAVADLNTAEEMKSYIDSLSYSDGEPLSKTDKKDILATAKYLISENSAANLDNAEGFAQQLADEDDTTTTVVKEDSDGDGDTDIVSVSKDTPEDDSEDNSSESKDEPRDEKNSTKFNKNVLDSFTSRRF